jgi:ribose transport system ATP-binding protein
LEEVLQIADRISVLRNGEYIKTIDDVAQTSVNEIVNLMIGQTKLFEIEKVQTASGDEALRVEDLNLLGHFSNIDFTLHRGEILGIAGLEGSGRYALGRALFGIHPYDSGRLYIFSEEKRIRNPRDAIKCKIGFLSRDRKEEGIFAKLNLLKNITMVTSLRDTIFNQSRYVGITQNFIDKLSIKCSSIYQNITSLSGGNQQKSIVSRWLAENPEVIIMEEPTHGIDVGAKAEMFRIMNDMAEQGASIIFISSELDELMTECNRIIVMHAGRITGDVIPSKTNKEEIMTLATGVSRLTG